MRYGFISDVHGNLEALEVVLAHLRHQALDHVVFLGDAVGYGANPNEVCDLIRSVARVAVLGNHDAAVAGRMSSSLYYDAARLAILWCAKRMTPDNMRWLKEMPYKVREGALEFCHGAPLAPELFDYLFGAEQVERLLPELDQLAQVTFIGHSHLTISFCIADDKVDAIFSSEIVCRPDAKYIITVGSVGQPRDRDPRACCGVYDTQTHTFNYHRLPYDIAATREKIFAAGLSPMFGERLLLGV